MVEILKHRMESPILSAPHNLCQFSSSATTLRLHYSLQTKFSERSSLNRGNFRKFLKREPKPLAICDVSSSLQAFASSPVRSGHCTWPKNKHRSNLVVQNPLKFTRSLQYSPSLQQASDLPTLNLGKNRVNRNLASQALHDFHESSHSFNDFPTLLNGSPVHKLRQLPFPANRPENRTLTRSSFDSRGEEVRLKIGDETRKCECYDQFRELVPYVEAWNWQKVRVEEKVRGLNMGEDVDDTVILLQHPPVYTMGTRSSQEFLKFDVEDPPYELHRTERGGEVTYHGPGQLVMYPILNLRHHNMDLHWYLRTLEEIVIGALEKSCGIAAHRITGLTGVWVGNRKVAAIGVRVSRWITYHGLALNVTTDLAPFSNIIPCGISDYAVTSVAKLLDEKPYSAWEARNHDPEFLLAEVHGSLLSEFAQKFNFQLVTPT